VFVSQHALAVHILSEHMNQAKSDLAEEDAGRTIEIPIGEEMVLVQSVEPGECLLTQQRQEMTRCL